MSYGDRGMDLGIRFLSYEVVVAPEAPTGVAVVVQRAQIMPQLSARSGHPQVWSSMKPPCTHVMTHGNTG